MKPTFYSVKDFPQLESLAQNWQAIRDEFHTLRAPILEITRTKKTHEQVFSEVMEHMESGGEYGWLMGWGVDGPNPDWIQYGLAAFGSIVPFAQEKLPRTTALLNDIKGVKVCALAKMKANSFLTCHQHPELEKEGLLQFHITLDAAEEKNYAYLNVKGEFAQNITGKAIIFDGSHDHFAINASGVDRTILYMEFNKDALMV